MATASPSGLPHAVKPCVGRGPLPPPEKSIEDNGKGGFDSRHPLHSKPLKFQSFQPILDIPTTLRGNSEVTTSGERRSCNELT